MTDVPLTPDDAATLGFANAESIVLALTEHDLSRALCSITVQGLGAVARPRVIVHMQGSAATVRAARLLFGTMNPPVHDPDHPTLLSYRGESHDYGQVEVFGSSAEQERQDARHESLRRTRRASS